VLVALILAFPATQGTQRYSEPPDIEWSKSFGGSGDDIAYSIWQTSDGGYIVVGTTRSFGAGDFDVLLVKFNSKGDVEWFKTFGGPKLDVVYSVQQTSDGGYIVAGYTESYGAGGWDILLIKFDSMGNVEWFKTYGGSADDWAYCVREAHDGGYVIAGVTRSWAFGGQDDEDVYIIKVDTQGNLQWNKTFGGPYWQGAFSLQVTRDGGFIVAGFGDVPSRDAAWNKEVLLVKLDSNGNVEWFKTFGWEREEYARSVKETSNGGFIVAGSTNSRGYGGFDVLVVKFNSEGDVEWFKVFGGAGHDRAFDILETPDGGFIVVGASESYGVGLDDVYIVKLDKRGNTLWSKTYGGKDYDRGYSILQAPDGGFIVAGGSKSFGTGGWDVLLLKLLPELREPRKVTETVTVVELETITKTVTITRTTTIVKATLTILTETATETIVLPTTITLEARFTTTAYILATIVQYQTLITTNTLIVTEAPVYAKPHIALPLIAAVALISAIIGYLLRKA